MSEPTKEWNDGLVIAAVRELEQSNAAAMSEAARTGPLWRPGESQWPRLADGGQWISNQPLSGVPAD